MMTKMTIFHTGGYRDIILNVALRDDDSDAEAGDASLAMGRDHVHVGELQLHIQSILDLKELSHMAYAFGRGVDFS